MGNNDHKDSTCSNQMVASSLDSQQQTNILGLVELENKPKINAATRIYDYSMQPIHIYPYMKDDTPILLRLVRAYHLITYLTKIFSHSSLDFLKKSPTHRVSLLEALGIVHLINVTPTLEAQVNDIDFYVYPPR